MSLKILGKKAAVLFLLFLAVICVYIIKNDSGEKYFGALKSIVWSVDIFKGEGDKDIKIDLSDINMESLTQEKDKAPQEIEPVREESEAGSDQIFEKEELTLESIQEKVNNIAVQVNKLTKEVDDLNKLVQVQEQLDEIARQVKVLSFGVMI